MSVYYTREDAVALVHQDDLGERFQIFGPLLTAREHVRVQDLQTGKYTQVHPWPISEPDVPVAVPLADRDGRFRSVVLDFDAKSGAHATLVAARQAEFARLFLEDRDIRTVSTVSGPTGGRHVWMTFPEGLPLESAKTIARGMKIITSSEEPSALDISMDCNAAAGSCRPVGAMHRKGGRSRLRDRDEDAVERALRVLREGNSLEAAERLIRVLPEVARPVVSGTSAVRPGGKYATRKMRRLLEHGEKDGIDQSGSAFLHSFAAQAATWRWTEEEAFTAAWDSDYVGDRLRREDDPEDYFARSWALVASGLANPALRESLEEARWLADIAVRRGSLSPAEGEVLFELYRLCELVNRSRAVVYASYELLGVLLGFSVGKVWKVLHSAQTKGWLELMEKGVPHVDPEFRTATSWRIILGSELVNNVAEGFQDELDLPPHLFHVLQNGVSRRGTRTSSTSVASRSAWGTTPPLTTSSGTPTSSSSTDLSATPPVSCVQSVRTDAGNPLLRSHPVFRSGLLGDRAWQFYGLLLLQGEGTPKALATAADVSLNTAYRTLGRMRDRLARVTDGTWSAIPVTMEDLDRLFRVLVEERSARRRGKKESRRPHRGHRLKVLRARRSQGDPSRPLGGGAS
jgi:hypothetical protein